MYNEWEKRENEKVKIQVALHGGKIDDTFPTETAHNSTTKEQSFVFRSPEDYEKMSLEDRKELTEKMLRAHKSALAESKTSLV